MNRRTFLATGAVSLSAIAGCLGGGGSSGDGDGYPPKSDQTPTERSIDTASFDTVEENGVQVPLAPIDVAYYWHQRGEARFADARGERSYKAAHILGAVLSPAPKNMRGSNDPVKDWPKEDLIVCYCGCPHHLSSIRASQLINEGYENVYVIDEGFGPWHQRGYPMAGNDVSNMPKNWVIRGETDPSYASQNAWARHLETEQMESTDIEDDGSYELHLKFYDVGPNSVVNVETPEYTIEGKLSELTATKVTG
ncbi:rhodanese-like domain-containing protein [Halorussus halophilus]|uniref:rhodanese-like domain-containing protein n=1 Tax=Halorussus halophilus TaxID=2650975 RepID=UPI00130150BE|nr:rhodanese-like domain-containing protein [Halorussus halophilus]